MSRKVEKWKSGKWEGGGGGYGSSEASCGRELSILGLIASGKGHEINDLFEHQNTTAPQQHRTSFSTA